jgi:serine/threonine protein kinase
MTPRILPHETPEAVQLLATAGRAPPSPPPRTEWARRVPHPGRNGHPASLTPYCCLAEASGVGADGEVLTLARCPPCAVAAWGGHFCHSVTGGLEGLSRHAPCAHPPSRRRAFGREQGGRTGRGADPTAGWQVPCAVKKFKEPMGAQDRADFVREGEILRSLAHPNVTRLLGVAAEVCGPPQDPTVRGQCACRAPDSAPRPAHGRRPRQSAYCGRGRRSAGSVCSWRRRAACSSRSCCTALTLGPARWPGPAPPAAGARCRSTSKSGWRRSWRMPWSTCTPSASCTATSSRRPAARPGRAQPRVRRAPGDFPGPRGGGDWDRGASAQRRPSVLGRVVTGCLCAQNLVYCEGQRHVVKLIDFGLACFFPPGVDELMRPTKARARTPPAPCPRDSPHLFQFCHSHGSMAAMADERPSPSLSTGRLRLSWRSGLPCVLPWCAERGGMRRAPLPTGRPRSLLGSQVRECLLDTEKLRTRIPAFSLPHLAAPNTELVSKNSMPPARRLRLRADALGGAAPRPLAVPPACCGKRKRHQGPCAAAPAERSLPQLGLQIHCRALPWTNLSMEQLRDKVLEHGQRPPLPTGMPPALSRLVKVCSLTPRPRAAT